LDACTLLIPPIDIDRKVGMCAKLDDNEGDAALPLASGGIDR
jgi:hypothetical protein